MRDELTDPALVVEPVALPGFPLIVERDDNAAVQEGQFPEALSERVETEDDRLEDLRRPDGNGSSCRASGRAGDLQIAKRLAAFVRLLVDLAVTPDFELERL